MKPGNIIENVNTGLEICLRTECCAAFKAALMAQAETQSLFKY